VLAACAVLSACGSTVQYSGTATVGPGGDGLSGTTGGTTGVVSTTGGGTTGGVGSTSGGPGGTTGSGTGTTGAAPGASTGGATSGTGTSGTGAVPTPGGGPTTGRGFTKTTIRLGVATANDSSAYASSLGVKGVGYEGDPRIWYSALAAELNKSGGLLGRRVELVPHDFNTAQALNNPAAANQQACTEWTQDKPVFAVVLAAFGAEDTLLSCLAKTSTPLIQIGAGLDYPLHYSEAYAKHPLYFNLAQMAGDRYDSIAISRLVARKFFSPWNTRTASPGTAATPAKVGLIGFDDHDGAVQLANEQRELAKRGIKVATSVACPRPLTQKVSCSQSAVLRFNSAGVTHVFGADTIFMNNANTQGYYPRFFVALEPALIAANVQSKSLSGAMGESYVPFLDVDPAQYPGDPTPATGVCKRIMKAAGQASSDPSTLWLQMSACDGFFFVRDAVKGAGALGPAALRAGLEGLASRTSSALAFDTFLGPKDHASAVGLRDLDYRSDLQAFAYVSRTTYRS
jgi:hypothetical protein